MTQQDAAGTTAWPFRLPSVTLLSVPCSAIVGQLLTRGLLLAQVLLSYAAGVAELVCRIANFLVLNGPREAALRTALSE